MLPITKAINLLMQICKAHAGQSDTIMQGVDGEYLHGREVLFWVRRLDPQAKPTLMLAALFHDIDRVITPGKGGGFKGDRASSAYLLHKKQHAQRSAEFIGPLLREKGWLAPRAIKRVMFLIQHHDDTGEEVDRLRDPDLNSLVVADTFAFFKTIALQLYKTEGKERVKDKVNFMVNKLPNHARLLLWRSRLSNPVFEQIKSDVILQHSLKMSENRSNYRFCPFCSRHLKPYFLNKCHWRRCVYCGFAISLEPGVLGKGKRPSNPPRKI
jgi:hypothetical protein